MSAETREHQRDEARAALRSLTDDPKILDAAREMEMAMWNLAYLSGLSQAIRIIDENPVADARRILANLAEEQGTE